jgi:DNA-binding MarR family transcriptional regulator
MNLQERQDAVNGSERPDEGRTPAGDAVSELAVHVFRLNGLLTAAGDAMAEPAGQTTARWRVLAAIEDRPLTVAQIARAWQLARQSVQRVADLLADDGLAAYEENPNHRRAKLLRITPAGTVALETIRGAQRVWADRLGEEVGEESLRAVNERLRTVIEALERNDSESSAAGSGKAEEP